MMLTLATIILSHFTLIIFPGTSFTDLAWKNNERVLHQNYLETASTDPHGHLELDTKRKLKWDLVWPGRPSNDSCDFDPQSVQEEQSRLLQQEFSLLKQHNITFASTEHWFPPLEVMDQHYDQATFAVLIREPMERLVSSFHFHLSGANRCPSGQRKCSFGDWAPAESNMHVKMLNGIPFGPLKVGKPCAREMFTFTITSEQYQNATKSLEKFHVVLTLQSVKEHPEQVACILQKALGWNVTSLPKKNTKRKRIQQRYIQKEELEQARLDNKWDLELYKRARELEQDLFAKLGCVW